jgi:hypothetical protein
MVRTCLDDAEWASLLLVIQDLPRTWKPDEAALRRFVEAALWICRTGSPPAQHRVRPRPRRSAAAAAG